MLPFETSLAGAGTVSRCIDLSFDAAQAMGFDALIYDFSPVPYSADEDFVLPTVIEYRNVPLQMRVDWCEHGLYRRDPVQLWASRLMRPFYWSYRAEEDTVIAGDLDERVRPVTERLFDWDLGKGVTVPLHLPGNRFATLTGFLRGRAADEAVLARFAYVAHVLQDGLDPKLRAGGLDRLVPALTPRELDCLRLSAEGLSDKQVAHRLGRSASTVVMHLQAAGKKLGARNRAQTIALAMRFGLLR